MFRGGDVSSIIHIVAGAVLVCVGAAWSRDDFANVAIKALLLATAFASIAAGVRL